MSGSARDSMTERQAARQLHAEIARMRGELTMLLGELDRRRHHLLNTRDQVKRHAPGLIGTGLAVLGAATGLVWFLRERSRRRQRPLARAARLREAVGRMVERPDRVAAQPGIPGKLLAAVASAALATTTKNVVERGIRAFMDSRSTNGHATRPSAEPQRPADLPATRPTTSELARR